jgi:hypothetical protein
MEGSHPIHLELPKRQAAAERSCHHRQDVVHQGRLDADAEALA